MMKYLQVRGGRVIKTLYLLILKSPMLTSASMMLLNKFPFLKERFKLMVFDKQQWLAQVSDIMLNEHDLSERAKIILKELQVSFKLN